RSHAPRFHALRFSRPTIHADAHAHASVPPSPRGARHQGKRLRSKNARRESVFGRDRGHLGLAFLLGSDSDESGACASLARRPCFLRIAFMRAFPSMSSQTGSCSRRSVSCPLPTGIFSRRESDSSDLPLSIWI